MVSESSRRVSDQTDPQVNEQIRRQTEFSIAFHREHPERIPDRLRELDEEWDIERTLQTNASTLTLVGLALTLLRGRKWLLLPLTVQSFLLQHSLQGWCPPLPLFRRMGFRTRDEIAQERHALAELHGGQRGAKHTAGMERGMV